MRAAASLSIRNDSHHPLLDKGKGHPKGMADTLKFGAGEGNRTLV